MTYHRYDKILSDNANVSFKILSARFLSLCSCAYFPNHMNVFDDCICIHSNTIMLFNSPLFSILLLDTKCSEIVLDWGRPQRMSAIKRGQKLVKLITDNTKKNADKGEGVSKTQKNCRRHLRMAPLDIEIDFYVV